MKRTALVAGSQNFTMPNKMKDKEWGEENRKMKRMRRDEKRKRFPINT